MKRKRGASIDCAREIAYGGVRGGGLHDTVSDSGTPERREYAKKAL